MPAIHERFTARVRALSSDGNGIVEHGGGQVFFVPGVWPGEQGEFRITGFKKRFGFAVLEQLLEPSPERVVAPCVHHGFGRGQCGGCPWQFVAYQAQLAAKESRVRQALARLADGERIAPIWSSPRTLGFRNRAQLKSDGRALGFVSAGSRQLAPVDDCLVLTDTNRATLRALAASLPNPAFRPSRGQDWTTLDIDEDIDAGQVALNRRRPFRQGNSEQNQRMRQWLAAKLDRVDKSVPVLELFAGSGNFTEVIAAAGFARTLAVEGSGDALAQLAAQGLPGVDTLACNLFVGDAVDGVRRRMPQAGVLVLDPPREGFREVARLLPKKHCLREVFYISCDLATFARDLQVFVAAGFEVIEVQPLDQFPHTPHVELLCHLSR
ncbi:MAG: class I SAM-dependent RNA methyltransferase [Porticoccaceae bacterium]